jgi:hypothetical protein
MKKTLLTIFTFIYIAISAGATMHLHECIDEAAVSFGNQHSDQDNKIPCDPLTCKLETQRKIVESSVKTSRVVPLRHAFPDHHIHHAGLANEKFPVAFTLARTAKKPLFILHRVFRV